MGCYVSYPELKRLVPHGDVHKYMIQWGLARPERFRVYNDQTLRIPFQDIALEFEISGLVLHLANAVVVLSSSVFRNGRPDCPL